MSKMVKFSGKWLKVSGGAVVLQDTPVQVYTYFKLDITAIRSYSIMQLSELEFYDAGGNKLAVSYVAGTPGTESTYGDENPPNMFDGRTDTKWCVRDTTAFVVGKAAGNVTAASYRMATANDTASEPWRNPSDWTIERAVSATDITARNAPEWVVIDTRTNDSTMGAQNETFYTFNISGGTRGATLMSTGKKGGTLLGGNKSDNEPRKEEDTILGTGGEYYAENR